MQHNAGYKGEEARFEQWLREHLRSEDREEARPVHELLEEPAAVAFLMAWSIFEAACCQTFAKADALLRLCRQLVASEASLSGPLLEAAMFFHDRYQDESWREGLAPHSGHSKDVRREWVDRLNRPFEELSPADKAFVALFVVFRLRNNIFHGVKPVHDWIRDRHLIWRGTFVALAFVDMQRRQTS